MKNRLKLIYHYQSIYNEAKFNFSLNKKLFINKVFFHCKNLNSKTNENSNYYISNDRIYNKSSIYYYSLFKMVESDKLLNADDVKKFLEKNGVKGHIQNHEPVLTCAEHVKIKCTENIEGQFIKNLIMKTKSGKFIYYMANADSKTDFKGIEKFTGEKNVRGADENVLSDILKIEKGSVNPFAFLNLSSESRNNFIMLIDSNVNAEYIVVHPMSNSYSLWIKRESLISVFSNNGIKFEIFDASKIQSTKEEKNDKKETKNVEVNKEEKHELSIQFPKSEKTFSDWYSDVITKSDMIDYYEISGCYILKPWSYEIWEEIQKTFNDKIKAIGVKNCYFPMFVSQDALEKEKDHVEGFSPEVAWVTHSGDKKLDKKIAIRPTSETVMYPHFSKWISSHRDLPLLMNQWCNVVRWEFKNPTPFIRTREFLWQEGHSVHTSEEESDKFMLQILDFYAEIYEDLLAVPVIKGFKSENEKFAGAHRTSTIETMVPTNGKGIQCATSHNLGQNFSKMFDIKYLDHNQEFQYCWQESWGLTTRTIGVMVMIHSDDSGLILPPRVAPIQIVLVPIKSSKDKGNQISDKIHELCERLKKVNIRAKVDDDEMHNPGFKFNKWELKGVPLRIEFGMKDLEKNQVVIAIRDTKEKFPCPLDSLETIAKETLDKMHQRLFNNAKVKYDENIKKAEDFDTFYKFLNSKHCILTPWCEDKKCEEDVKEKVKNLCSDDSENIGTCKTLCLPIKQDKIKEGTKCFCCDKAATKYALWGRSY